MTLWWPLDGPDDPDGSPSPPTVTVYSLLTVRPTGAAPPHVVVPPGGHAGDLLQVTDPMGRVVTATVPEGLREGDKFSLPYVKQVPVAQGVVVARATPAAGGEGEPSEAKQGG